RLRAFASSRLYQEPPHMNALFPLVATLLLAGAPHTPQRGDDFEWKGTLRAGKTIEIVGVNGSIDASGSAGSEVQVTASKDGRRSDPREVEIVVVEHADGVTICAVYPSARRGEENECKAGG